MNPNRKNDYFDALKPILYLMKMDGIFPMRFTLKDHSDNFLNSKMVSVITTSLYAINMAYTLRRIYYLTDHLWQRFSSNVFVALIPNYSEKISIFIIAWKVWSRGEQMEKYWSKWLKFQDEYAKLTGKQFVSNLKTMSFWFSMLSLFLTIFAIVLGYLYLMQDGIVGLISDSVNTISALIMGIYWFMNHMYSRACAMTVISLAKRTLEEGTNWGRLNKINDLWILLCDLVEEFNVLHGSVFLIYTGSVVLNMILFAYISMYYSKFSDSWNKNATISGTVICAVMILVVCEMGYSVYRQLNINLKHTLLEYNTVHMKVDMLQSVSFEAPTKKFELGKKLSLLK
ncbi:uncharacterized protein LOC135845212 [Planococcus citri]|uniref:uncharacterized protein LOC135845212 n=1 Tax=Planococcus citri TaxID=170843 RepID=UPI0031F74EDE